MKNVHVLWLLIDNCRQRYVDWTRSKIDGQFVSDFARMWKADVIRPASPQTTKPDRPVLVWSMRVGPASVASQASVMVTYPDPRRRA